MNKQRFKIIYDRESEVLSVEMKKGKSADSDIRGNVVIDYDRNGDVVRVNFYQIHFNEFKADAGRLKHAGRRTPVSVAVR